MKCIQSLILCLALLGASSCANYSFGHRDANCDPDTRLGELLAAWEEGQRDIGWRLSYDCDRLRYEVERLSLEFPAHVPTHMACAVLAYESAEPEKAQNYLDRIFRDQPAHPEAGILRSRIAIDDGNLELAQRVLRTQIQYTPDHPGLREALSGCLYMDGDLAGAAQALSAAERLGAPPWRVAYHRGLIAEAQGDTEEAARQYQAALDAKPDHRPSRSRLSGMNAAGG
jgi:tetratricopeptide (TPR) repeat protein